MTEQVRNASIPTSLLDGHARNYRSHPPEQIKQLVASLKRFQQVRSLVVKKQAGCDRYTILAGHGLVEAARECFYPELRCDIVPDSWDEMTCQAYLIADNHLSNGAVDDDELLATLLQEQQDAGFDLASMGSDDETLRQMLANMGDAYLGDGGSAEEDEQVHQSLAERFIVPPFSVLDARQGYWQERKRAWIALGIQSELGRGDCVTCPGDAVTEPGLNYYRNRQGNKMGGTPIADSNGGLADQLANKERKGLARCFGQDLMRGEHTVGQNAKRLTWVAGDRPLEDMDDTSRKNLSAGRKGADQRSNLNNAPKKPDWASGTGTENMAAGTSIFDPVLCELAYRWFSPPDGLVLDPFAGGSVRGIVAALTGRRYIGIDLRSEQVEANEQQVTIILSDEPRPQWIVGDSRNLATLCPDVQPDLIFTCPPYYDLEVYSNNESDLSALATYEQFMDTYRVIFQQAITQLKHNRFVCVVVGDIRDKRGFYRNFVSDTISACEDAGAQLYNEAILVTSVGSLPIRVGKQFTSSRKLGKTHQNVLVFCKGDPVQAVKDCGPVVVEVPEEEEIEDEEGEEANV